MTNADYNPLELEENIMSIVNKLTKEKGKMVIIETLLSEIQKTVSNEISLEVLAKSIKRLTQEGFIEEQMPGTLVMLDCGNLDFDEIE